MASVVRAVPACQRCDLIRSDPVFFSDTTRVSAFSLCLEALVVPDVRSAARDPVALAVPEVRSDPDLIQLFQRHDVRLSFSAVFGGFGGARRAIRTS